MSDDEQQLARLADAIVEVHRQVYAFDRDLDEVRRAVARANGHRALAGRPPVRRSSLRDHAVRNCLWTT